MKWSVKYILVCAFVLIINSNAKAQTIANQSEFWGAYISSIKITEKFALWNDFHFVSTSFFASRHGLTYSPSKNFDLTAGYAFVITSTSFSDNLIRNEHRPWGQVVGRFKLSKRISYQFRFRYDARFRQAIKNDEVLNDRIFYNRLRLLNDFRFTLKELSDDSKIHFDIMDEFLVNVGKQVTNGVDQNRLYLLFGYSQKNLTLLGGYDWRVIPMQNRNFVFRHGITLWIIHTIDLQRKKS